MLSGNVLITGGAGYLGRAIIYQARKENWPVNFTVYSRDETKQWELKHKYPEVKCLLGSVSGGLERLIAAFTGQDVVIHAGAVKYIPEAEHNVLETLETNVTGSRQVGFAAIAAGVRTVVGVSTDKACSPLNVYGMTKALMERMYSEFDRISANTRFVTVRYGNVIGSTGSVIPLFSKQIKEQGKILLTSPEMTRFWMTPSQAVQLVKDAADNVEEWHGSTVIARCPAMRMIDVAKAVGQMNGMGKVPIEVTGIRPGEKLHEFLYNEPESYHIKDAGVGSYQILMPSISKAMSPIAPYSSEHPDYSMVPVDILVGMEEASKL
jgi:UDP-N-acetylglucosamine 4,6-dehydratase